MMKSLYMSDDAVLHKPKRMWAWMWFAYTGFIFIEPVFEPSWRNWLSAIGVLLVFFGIFYVYERASSCSSPIRYWMIVATFVLGALTFPWNGGGTTFFVYAAGFLPFNIRSTAKILALFALESLLILGEARLIHHSMGNAIFAVFLLVIIGGSNIFFAEQRSANAKLRLAHNEIEAIAAVAERERIARDLHDVLGHTLSVIVLKAELAGRLIELDPQRAAAEINEVERITRSALAEVREAIGGYRSRGLAAEIESARKTLAAANVDLHAEAADVGTTQLNAEEETVFALALREAVTNIVRHAHARHCRLRFVTTHGVRRLVVEDDGSHTSTREGNGLRGMRERVEALGGQLSLDRHEGTRLQVELPLQAKPA